MLYFCHGRRGAVMKVNQPVEKEYHFCRENTYLSTGKKKAAGISTPEALRGMKRR